MTGVGLPLPWGIIPAEHVRRTITVPDPPAGTEWSVTVPGGVVWRVLMGRFTLSTGATGSGREVGLFIRDGSVEVGRTWSQVNQAVSTVAIYGFFPGASPVGFSFAGLGLLIPWPDVLLLAGYTIGSGTLSLGAADQYSGIALLVEEHQVRGLERAAERYARALAEAIGGG